MAPNSPDNRMGGPSEPEEESNEETKQAESQAAADGGISA